MVSLVPACRSSAHRVADAANGSLDSLAAIGTAQQSHEHQESYHHDDRDPPVRGEPYQDVVEVGGIEDVEETLEYILVVHHFATEDGDKTVM